MFDNAHLWIVRVWEIIGIFWLVNAFRRKPTVRAQPIGPRLIPASLQLLAAGLLFFQWPHIAPLNARVWPDSTGATLTGMALTVAGALLAIVARVYLGRNWSGHPSIKESHELIREGPYALVRHPIYTGLLLAALGTALAFGQTRDLIALPVGLLGFWLKLGAEERLLLQAFGKQYSAYRQAVKNAIIPLIL